MDIDNTINYWLNVKPFNEAKTKVITGDFEKSTNKDLELLKKLEIQDTDVVLDFGCGIGRLTKPISEICGEITGADISEDMIGHATNYCEKENVLFKILNNEEGNGLFKESYDKAFSFIVIQHIEKPKAFQVLFNIFKALKVNGKMLIQFPNLEKNEVLYKNYIMFKQKFGALEPRMEFYTKTELKYIFDVFKMDYQIIEKDSDFYVLATKKEDINIQEYYVNVSKWKD